jgi:energy-converting hydrogenase Eha subunit A
LDSVGYFVRMALAPWTFRNLNFQSLFVGLRTYVALVLSPAVHSERSVRMAFTPSAFQHFAFSRPLLACGLMKFCVTLFYHYIYWHVDR